ncbi:unnamed protein product [Calypogeia fissa]
MQSDEWEQYAILLQMEEWSKSSGSKLKSNDTADLQEVLSDLQAVAADLRDLGLLDQHQLKEQQLRQDEELARELEQSLCSEENNAVKKNSCMKSLFTPFVQATAANRRCKEEVQVDKTLKGEQEHSAMLVKEQQLWQDEELAWRMEHGTFSQNQQYDLFYAESTDDRGYVGVGCIIKDADGRVVFENRESIGLDISHYIAEYNALFNGLEFARSLGLRHINAYGNRAFIYWEVQGQLGAPWIVPEHLEALQEQIKGLDTFTVNCVSQIENEGAIKLANYAAEHAPTEHAPSLKRKSALKEDTRPQCLICLETIFPDDIVRQKECRHRFCYDCLSQHVETEISRGKVPIRCPQFVDCALHIDDNDCKRLVSPKVFDTYSTRLTEATISEFEKVYCPFPGCSALMCRTDENKTNIYAASSSTSSPRRPKIGSAECMECHRLFCVECHVPWHADLTCQEYQNLPPDERDAEDRKIFQLAKDEKWRRCSKCRSLIILAAGCVHMTCRCGNEFCYTCGTNYVDTKKICQC